MKIAFFGHAQFCKNKQPYTDALRSILDERVGNQSAELMFGGYGDFDSFAHRFCKDYQKEHPNVRLVYVTPYLTEDHQRRVLDPIKKDFDEIIYPALEHVPMRFAIVQRNAWMAKEADLVICYVLHDWGGAYKACKKAAKMNKELINLAPLESEERLW